MIVFVYIMVKLQANWLMLRTFISFNNGSFAAQFS